ncbi:hypothetical protein QNO07_19725 [Streptomyces sp. 549]|uniref:hypothetical protein n=1 Tax=Streptomyces sp. 549 TaxID=3049076 RepID=UPI0024C3A81A|nr:hypothetical protein [Streptomyces sp. 549]MDK1475619.1 hypothetical protein [Streptomyces sp. 549]
MVANFGGGSFDSHLWIHAPRGDGEPYDLADGAAERMEALCLLWQAGEGVPSWLDARRDKLIAWASTGNGECIYWWNARGQASADDWPVAVQSIDGDWEVFEMSSSDLLLAWVTGCLRTELLSADFAHFSHSFSHYDGRILE